MKRTDFINEICEYCEFENEDFTLDTQLNSINEYDSMAILSIIAFIDERFRTKLTSKQLQNLSDFKSVIEFIGVEKFEDD
jgi:acyl carrier protein